MSNGRRLSIGFGACVGSWVKGQSLCVSKGHRLTPGRVFVCPTDVDSPLGSGLVLVLGSWGSWVSQYGVQWTSTDP